MSFIETERCILRTWMLPGDAADAAALYGDPDVMRYIPRGPADVAGASRIVAHLIALDETQNFGIWPVIEKSTRALVGTCGLAYVPGTADVEIAWLFKREAWGHGYATEAGRAVLEFAFGHAGLRKVYALIDPMNERSIRVANRLEMRYDRIVRAYDRDLMRYVKEAPAEELPRR